MFSFIKKLFFWALKTVAGLILIYLVLLGVLYFLARHYAPQLPDKGMLVIDVERGWVETPLEQPPFFDLARLGGRFLGTRQPYSLLQALEAIEAGTTDPRIFGLLVVGDFSQAQVNRIGLSGIMELGAAIRAFGEEKPAFVHLKNPAHADLLLASYAENRLLSPDGDIIFTGIATETLMFAETFETVGIGVQLVREGAHKSAVEPYLRKSFSSEAKAQQERLTDQLWKAYLDQLIENTGTEAAVFERWADERGILKPSELREAGFARILSYPRLLDEMTQLVGPHPGDPDTFSQIDLQTYLGMQKRRSSASSETPDAKVAVVFVEGIIASQDTAIITDGERIARQIRKVRKSGHYDALLLRVNSPGGAVFPSRVIARELGLAKEEIPVFVSMGQYAASGGYWVAAGGDRVSGNPLTLTGSIGVFSILLNIEEGARKLGLHWERSKSAEMANLFSMSEARSPAQIRALEGLVSRTYNEFLDFVALNRQLSQAEVENVAEGKVWTGTEASQRQLVDEAEGFLPFRQQILQRLEAEQLQLTFYGKEPANLLTLAMNWLQGSIPFDDAVNASEVIRSLQRYQGPISYLPLRLTF